MEPIRVIIIDDSAFMRKMITDILTSDHRIQVSAAARNGQDGLEKINKHHPDVVTLDVEMPVMDGMTALKHIMKENPLPVVMLSSVTGKGAEQTMQAIAGGAVDFIEKPSGAISLDIKKIKDEMIAKVLAASQVKLRQPKSQQYRPQQPAFVKTPPRQYKETMIVIGTSTGGPKALQQILTALPANFPAPILIVQHMPPGFTLSLARRLDSLSELTVKEAVCGEVIQKGCAYIAPGGYHMKVRSSGTNHIIELTEEKAKHGHRPAADILFESVAGISMNKIAIILTGMGSDGAAGFEKVRETDDQAVLIAEAEETAVVYGMPRAAVMTGTVNHVISLQQIADFIARLTGPNTI
jgi:two-component system chemotaxis response regulator CheB